MSEPPSPRGLQTNIDGQSKHIRGLISKARTSWLKNTEVIDILQNFKSFGFKLNRETPICPPGAGAYGRALSLSATARGH